MRCAAGVDLGSDMASAVLPPQDYSLGQHHWRSVMIGDSSSAAGGRLRREPSRGRRDALTRHLLLKPLTGKISPMSNNLQGKFAVITGAYSGTPAHRPALRLRGPPSFISTVSSPTR